MAVIAQGQKTIVDLTDPIQQGTAPANPVAGMLWLDTSQSPPQLKRWSGSTWELVNEVKVGGTNLIANSEEIILEPNTSNYNYRALYAPLEQGESYTVSVESVVLNEGTATGVTQLYYDLAAGTSGGSVGVFQIGNERQNLTFTPRASVSNTWSLLVYAGISGATNGVGVTLHKIKLERGSIATDWSPAPEDIVEDISLQLTDTRAQITASANTIRQEVEATYAQADDLATIVQQLTTISEQTETSFTWTAQQLALLQSDVESSQTSVENRLAEIMTYMKFDSTGLTIGKSGNPVSVQITNDRLSFLVNGGPVAYFSDNRLYVENGEFLASLKLGRFSFVPQSNGNLSLTLAT